MKSCEREIWLSLVGLVLILSIWLIVRSHDSTAGWSVNIRVIPDVNKTIVLGSDTAFSKLDGLSNYCASSVFQDILLKRAQLPSGSVVLDSVEDIGSGVTILSVRFLVNDARAAGLVASNASALIAGEFSSGGTNWILRIDASTAKLPSAYSRFNRSLF